jgi:hypothetical protein
VERLHKLIAVHPEAFSDEVFLPCGPHQLGNLLSEVVQVADSGLDFSLLRKVA